MGSNVGDDVQGDEEQGSVGDGSDNEGSEEGSQKGSNEGSEESSDEESDAGSGGSGGEESEHELTAHSDAETVEIESDMEVNTSQGASSKPEVCTKDTEEQQKTSHCNFVHSKDTEFSAWQDAQFEEGNTKWSEHDAMTCNHTEAPKIPTISDPLRPPIKYMRSQDVFNPIPISM